MKEGVIVSLIWLFIIVCWKFYKDKVISSHKQRITYLEERLRRNNVYYETSEL